MKEDWKTIFPPNKKIEHKDRGEDEYDGKSSSRHVRHEYFCGRLLYGGSNRIFSFICLRGLVNLLIQISSIKAAQSGSKGDISLFGENPASD